MLLLYVRSRNRGPVTAGLASDGILYRLDDIESEKRKLSDVALLYLLGFSSSVERYLISSRSFRSEWHNPQVASVASARTSEPSIPYRVHFVLSSIVPASFCPTVDCLA